MKRRNEAIVIIILVVAAFTFFAPLVYVMPTGFAMCPANGCNFPVYGSLTYYAFGVGGVLMQRGYFTIIG